jgi:hypothetical protein
VTSKILLRICLIGGILFCLLITLASVKAYPAILTSLDDSIVFLVLLGIASLGYILIAMFTTRSRMPDVAMATRRGLQWGAITGIFWLIEVLAGNLGDIHQAWVMVAYFGGALIAYGLPLITALIGARSTGRATAGIVIGLWSGMIGAIITFLGLMVLTALFMGVMQVRSDNIAEFHRSNAPDIMTFLIGDALAGGINHLLLIGTLFSGILGVIGGFAGKALATQESSDGRPSLATDGAGNKA